MGENDLLTGYTMGQNESRNNGGFGNWGDWIVILVLFALLGGGGFGFGGFGGGGAGLQGLATRADINSGFQFNDLQNGIRGIERGLCDGFYGVQNGINGLSAQLAQCCCDNRAAIADLKYTAATEACATRNLMQTNARDIIEAQNAGTRAVLDFLTQDKISTLTAENQALKFAASQANQNAYLTATMDANKAEILRRTGHECPTAAYIVQPPTPVTFPANGCGCGYAA